MGEQINSTWPRRWLGHKNWKITSHSRIGNSNPNLMDCRLRHGHYYRFPPEPAHSFPPPWRPPNISAIIVYCPNRSRTPGRRVDGRKSTLRPSWLFITLRDKSSTRTTACQHFRTQDTRRTTQWPNKSNEMCFIRGASECVQLILAKGYGSGGHIWALTDT